MSDDQQSVFTDHFDSKVVEAAQGAASRVLAEHGCMLDGFVIAVNFVRGDDAARGWIAAGPDDQFHDVTFRMFEHATAYHDEVRRVNFRGMLADAYEDDDDD